MKEFIYLKLDKQSAQSLARIFSLLEVNMRINPEKYSEKAKELHFLFEQLDEEIHDAGYCDRTNCSFLIKKKQLQEKQTIQPN